MRSLKLILKKLLLLAVLGLMLRNAWVRGWNEGLDTAWRQTRVGASEHGVHPYNSTFPPKRTDGEVEPGSSRAPRERLREAAIVGDSPPLRRS